jgi:serine/threonine-protein kinase
MICPHCRAENSDEALRCARCGVAFSVLDNSETLGPSTPYTPPPEPPSGSPSPYSPSSAGASWPAAAGFPSLEPGSDLGPRYRIESMLGEGGMGAVYKAYDRELNRTVALKLLRPGLMTDASALQRFKQELLLASKISHKNILRIHDLADVSGLKFISMAFVEGDDLHGVLRKAGRLPLDRAIEITKQLCAALEAAHAEGVVHRDLKPHNVLLDASGNAYVSDFGLAKSLEAGTVGMTRAGEFLGTPRYMSPEQVEGGKLDHRSDLYSLGLIIYEMATGEVPFTSDSTLALMYQRVKQKPKDPRKLNAELPDYLARVILRCLEKDPAKRYQSAREILNDLDPQRGSATRVGSVSMQITLPAVDMNKWIYVGGGALLLILLLVLGVPKLRTWFRSAPAGETSAVPAASDVRYLAVLPFRVAGEAESYGHIAEGVVEALSTKLFQLKALRVASPGAVERVREKDSIAKAARELGVSLVVHGMVQGAGDRIRITVNVEDVAGSKRLWSGEFSGLAQDLLTLEDQIFGEVVGALGLKPASEELARSSTRPTENFEAYELYLKGRTALRMRADVRNVEAAVRFFEQALKTDPAFAIAYAGLADASLRMYREKKDDIWVQKAVGAAQQGQRLNDALPETHFALGSAYIATGKTAEAVVELRRALELAPGSDEGYRRLGDAYRASGLKAEAIQAYKRAVEVNPYYWENHNKLGSAHLRAGENDKALEAFRRVTELEPDNPVGHENIGIVYFRQGKWEECIPAFQKALSIRPYFSVYSNLGTAYFFLKQYDDAVPMFEKAVEMNPNEEVAVGNLADAYRWSGRLDQARATYDRAISLAYKELQVNPRNAVALSSLAIYYGKKGDAAKAREFIRRARSINPTDGSLVYISAVVNALANRPEQAVKDLREAFTKGYPPGEAWHDPELAVLQANPEFQKLFQEFKGK